MGLSYEDECILVGTGVTRSFTRDRDVQPDTVLYFTVRLRETISQSNKPTRYGTNFRLESPYIGSM